MEMEQYLKVSEVIDWQHPKIMECAKQIASGYETPTAIAKACFEWCEMKFVTVMTIK